MMTTPATNAVNAMNMVCRRPVSAGLNRCRVPHLRRKALARVCWQICCLVGPWFGLLSLSAPLVAQVRRVEIDAVAPAVAAPDPVVLINDLALPLAPGQQEEQQDGGKFALGAVLKTDPDLESVLEKAARYQADGNWDVASQLWQAVLERSNDTLVSADGTHYRSMLEQVEAILSSLPPEGLAVYRITADANARALMAAAGDPYDIQALGSVVQRYFPGSDGDDAALRLAAVLMDRHEFVGAQRLLEKILRLHPDPSVDRNEVVSRLALCLVLSGNVEQARSLAEAEPEAMSGPGGRVVREWMDQLGTDRAREIRGMIGGTFAAFRQQPSLPAGLLEKELTAVWQFAVDPQTTYNADDARGKMLQTPPQPKEDFAAGLASSSETSFHRAWRIGQWQPVGELLQDGERIFFRTFVGVIAWPLEPAEERSWASAWLNRYEPDARTKHFQALRAQMGGNGFGRRNNPQRPDRVPPDNETTIQLFGDRIHSSMTLADNRLLVIEGSSYDVADRSRRNNQRGIQWNQTSNRSRTNWLTAYEASTGRALWRVPETTAGNPAGAKGVEPVVEAPADGDVAAEPLGAVSAVDRLALDAGGFMGPPAVVGNMIYAAHIQGGTIHVYGLDANQNGKVVWKTYLCDEPESGAPPWSPLVITADGSDLFVGSGMGVVFCLDRATGTIRFAQRYERTGRPNREFQAFGFAQATMDFSGFSEDVILPWGREMICFLSDSDSIFSLDRRTGELVWKAGLAPLGEPLDYILGIHNRVLYAAGRQTVVAFDLDGDGRMLWGGDPLFAGDVSLGRGILTESGILLPVGQEIWEFALQPDTSTPSPVRRTPVNLGMDAPVGNLMSDGSHLWVHNGNRIFRLDNIQPAGWNAGAAGSPSPKRNERSMMSGPVPFPAGPIPDKRPGPPSLQPQ